MNKLKNILSKTKYEAGIFLTLCVNFLLFFTKEDLMSDIIYPMHLVDLKAGFISRTLAGTISGILWEHPTKTNIIFLHTAVVILSFLLTAVFLGRCIRSADKKSADNLFIVCIAVAVLPYGFMSFINLFELLDIYWLMSVALCLLCADNKKAAFLIPVFILTGSWAHYSFFLAFMPVIYILCIEKCVREKTRLTYILTAVMVTLSVPTVIYFFATSRSVTGISFDEFITYILEKAGSEITSMERYVGKSFRSFNEMNRIYHIVDAPSESVTGIAKLAAIIYGNVKFALEDTSLPGILCDFLLASPLLAFFECIWKKAMKAASDKKEKFIYFLCLISPLVQFFACFTSSDTSRWMSLMIISCLFMLALLIKEGHKAVSDSFNSIVQRLAEHRIPLLFFFIFYLSIVFVW